MDIPPMSASGLSRRPVKTALHQAILDERIHQVRLLVEKKLGDVDSQDVYGRTPLMLACLLDNQEYGYKMAKLFIENGCYINMQDNMNRTALHYACMKGRYHMVRKLLREDNINVNLQDSDGNNALMLAALSGHPNIVEVVVDIVVKFGLSVDERNTMGYTAFLLACKHGHYVSAYYLLVKGCAQADIRDLECNRTAKEWVKESFKNNSHSTSKGPYRSKTMPEFNLGPLAFTREHTMYPEQEDMPVCRHLGTAPHPGSKSLGSALKLPQLFKEMGAENDQVENIIFGKDARDILLRAMDASVKNPKTFRRPNNRISLSRLPTTSNSRVTSSISRATMLSNKLQAIIEKDGKNSKAITPDITMLFKLYSDKYVGVPEGVHDMTSRESLHHVRFDTTTETYVESPMKLADMTMPSSGNTQELL